MSGGFHSPTDSAFSTQRLLPGRQCSKPRSLQTGPSERPLKIHNFRFLDMFDGGRCIFTCCLERQNWDPHVDQFQTWRTPNFLFHIRIPHLNFDSAESISSEKCSTNDIKRDWNLYQAECHWSACIWQIKCQKSFSGFEISLDLILSDKNMPQSDLIWQRHATTLLSDRPKWWPKYLCHGFVWQKF